MIKYVNESNELAKEWTNERTNEGETCFYVECFDITPATPIVMLIF